MYSVVNTAAILGIDASMVAVETDVSEGLPGFDMVGLLGSEVREAKDRVRSALRHMGICLPPKKVTINLAPANIKKSGTGFDLPIAISLMGALERLNKEKASECVFCGELSLDGRIIPIAGVLAIAIEARNKGFTTVIVPKENALEATLVPGLFVVPAGHISDVVDFIEKGQVQPLPELPQKEKRDNTKWDFSMINGQQILKRACEVAISGMHNLLMVGPPGAGKSMMAKCIPSILPKLTIEEQIEISKIYSVCGMLNSDQGLISERPFRSPHHTISQQGMVGGGIHPKPGEISLANSGVLFLDELTEFQKVTLEVLRQPLEDKVVNISRVNGNFTFPADFTLVAALNPCQCGYFPDLNKCHCTPAQINRYLGKISQPLLDRIDICVEVSSLSFEDIVNKGENESSAEIQKRVERCQDIQAERYAKESFSYNSQIPGNLIDKYCALNAKEKKFMEEMYETLGLTARTYHKLLKVARTIADMAGSEDVKLIHLQEAVCYRGLDKRYYERY